MRRLATAALALAGLVAAAGITLAANELTGQRIGIAEEPIRAGDQLARPETTPERTATPRPSRTPRATPTAAATPATTEEAEVEDDDDGKGRGRGRGRGGDDDDD